MFSVFTSAEIVIVVPIVTSSFVELTPKERDEKESILVSKEKTILWVFQNNTALM